MPNQRIRRCASMSSRSTTGTGASGSGTSDAIATIADRRGAAAACRPPRGGLRAWDAARACSPRPGRDRPARACQAARRASARRSPRSSCTSAQRPAEPTSTSVAPAMRWLCEVLAGLVDVELVMRVLEGRHREPARDQARDHLGEERGLAGAAPAREADDAHGRTYSSPAHCRLLAAGALASAYSAGCICPAAGGTPPLAASCSASHRLWCCFAQLTSTVPVPIASKAPSMPIVPM